jgi:antitoxin VapB
MKRRPSRAGETVFGVAGHPVDHRTLDLYVRCIYISYILSGGAMKKAKLFTTGGSQAVRLPAEFRFEGNEVDIRRDPVTGEVVLSKPNASWDEYFDWVRTLDIPDDLLGKRDQPKDDLRDPLRRPKRD